MVRYHQEEKERQGYDSIDVNKTDLSLLLYFAYLLNGTTGLCEEQKVEQGSKPMKKIAPDKM